MTRTWLLSAALAGALLTGCTGGTGGTGGTDEGRSEPPATGSPSTGAPSTEASGDPRAQTETIAEQTVVPDVERPDDTTTIGVQSLEVEGETTVLRLVLTPDFASRADGEEILLAEAVGALSLRFGVDLRLLDRENLKEYSVVQDPSGRRWASEGREVSSRNGEPMYAFAVFAAPEDDVTTFDLLLNQNWPELVDVPVTR